MIMTTLLSGCKSKQAESNPLLETWSTPFGVPPFDKIKTEHFKPAVEAGIRLHEAQIDSIVKNTETPSFGNVIEALDRSGEVLNNAYTVFSPAELRRKQRPDAGGRHGNFSAGIRPQRQHLPERPPIPKGKKPFTTSANTSLARSTAATAHGTNLQAVRAGRGTAHARAEGAA